MRDEEGKEKEGEQQAKQNYLCSLRLCRFTGSRCPNCGRLVYKADEEKAPVHHVPIAEL